LELQVKLHINFYFKKKNHISNLSLHHEDLRNKGQVTLDGSATNCCKDLVKGYNFVIGNSSIKAHIKKVMNPQIYGTHNQDKKSLQCNPHDKVQSLGHGSDESKAGP